MAMANLIQKGRQPACWPSTQPLIAVQVQHYSEVVKIGSNSRCIVVRYRPSEVLTREERKLRYSAKRPKRKLTEAEGDAILAKYAPEWRLHLWETDKILARIYQKYSRF